MGKIHFYDEKDITIIQPDITLNKVAKKRVKKVIPVSIFSLHYGVIG